MWREIPIETYICERMLGFSVPQEGSVLVVSYEGMHLVHLGPPVTVETDNAYCTYDLHVAGDVWRYKDREWQIIGLEPGRPLLLSPQGEWLELDDQTNTISVLRSGETLWSSQFENFSGDWAAVTFSPDGQFIVLGCPYAFDFRVWHRVGGATAG